MSTDYVYFRVPQWRINEWELAYSPLNVEGELAKMKLWLDANPKRRKKNYLRFCMGWLAREHAKIQRAQIESRAYARVGSSGRDPSPEQHEANLRLIAEMEAERGQKAY